MKRFTRSISNGINTDSQITKKLNANKYLEKATIHKEEKNEKNEKNEREGGYGLTTYSSRWKLLNVDMRGDWCTNAPIHPVDPLRHF